MLGSGIDGYRNVDDRSPCERIVRNEGLGPATAGLVAKSESDYISLGNIAFLDVFEQAHACVPIVFSRLLNDFFAHNSC